MKFSAVILALVATTAAAFGPSTPLRSSVARSTGALTMEYIPDGLTKEQVRYVHNHHRHRAATL